MPSLVGSLFVAPATGSKNRVWGQKLKFKIHVEINWNYLNVPLMFFSILRADDRSITPHIHMLVSA